MGKHRGVVVLMVISLFVFLITSAISSSSSLEEEEKAGEKGVCVSRRYLDMLKALFNQAGEKGVCVSRRYLDMLKALFNQANLHFSSTPPLQILRDDRMDSFRGGPGGGEVGDPKGGGEKVKEAAVKSLEKSKATMEGSARSAAEMTGKTIRNTKEKVKKSLSHEL